MIRQRLPRWPGFSLAALLVWPAVSAAQFVEPPAPAAYALENVTVVRADGSQLAAVSLVIRNGLIEAMGPGAAIPADAKLIEGDSLYIYPGIVDAVGHAAYELPEVEIDRSELASWDPPRDVQSFMPHRQLASYLTGAGKEHADQRKKGVAAAAVHPTGRLMPGRGVLVMFRRDARRPEELVLQPVLGPLMTFRGSQGVYPSTLFAVIAFYRQTFENAKHWSAQLDAYNRNPQGLTRPAWDPDLSVVRDAMARRAPVFFAVDKARDIQRVLKLAREYGFRPIIVGGEEAWKVTDELKAADVPVLVSLDFPKPDRWKPEKKTSGAKPTDNGGEDEELDAATLREKQQLEAIYANAGKLAAAGVRFALTSNGGEADFLEGTRKAIEYGLPEGAALAAVTSSPAAILGIGELVRIEAGRPATFLVTSGPLFEEETKILWTFVEGAPEEGKKERASGEAPSVDMTGTWDLSIDAEGEMIAAKMILEQEGAAVTGVMQTPFGDAKVSEGVVSGANVNLTIKLSMGQETIDIEVSGTVEGDEASGSGESTMGSFTWTAKRTSGPGGETER